jgi:hypothetical protein
VLTRQLPRWEGTPAPSGWQSCDTAGVLRGGSHSIARFGDFNNNNNNNKKIACVAAGLDLASEKKINLAWEKKKRKKTHRLGHKPALNDTSV